MGSGIGTIGLGPQHCPNEATKCVIGQIYMWMAARQLAIGVALRQLSEPLQRLVRQAEKPTRYLSGGYWILGNLHDVQDRSMHH
jgi:hypothetical protein